MSRVPAKTRSSGGPKLARFRTLNASMRNSTRPLPPRRVLRMIKARPLLLKTWLHGNQTSRILELTELDIETEASTDPTIVAIRPGRVTL